ncbi:hypothetical protein [Sulfitobacter sediminilitoris]|uniref:hypothetical protein n=1 Tax=Sulfitobacter sediminilitoris TaxID=2698830 RepID=UPI003606ADEE
MLSTQPDFLKGGIVLLDPETGTVERTLPLLINPERITRSFDVKSMGEESNRSAPLRLTGPAVETISIEARLEVSDALQRGDQTAVEEGCAHSLRHYRCSSHRHPEPSSITMRCNNRARWKSSR